MLHRAKIGPFIDQSSGKPNPDPDFAAAELAKQYSSVFVEHPHSVGS